MYQFVDTNGNILIWKTQKYIDETEVITSIRGKKMLTIVTNDMEFIHPDNCIEWVTDGILFTVNGEWVKVEHNNVFRIFSTKEDK